MVTLYSTASQTIPGNHFWKGHAIFYDLWTCRLYLTDFLLLAIPWLLVTLDYHWLLLTTTLLLGSACSGHLLRLLCSEGLAEQASADHAVPGDTIYPSCPFSLVLLLNTHHLGHVLPTAFPAVLTSALSLTVLSGWGDG
jgi:hypothetical protein